MFIIGGETQVQRLQLDPGRADQLCVQDGELLNRRDLESDRREDVACRQELDGGGSVCGSADVHRIVSSTLSLGSISESNSSTPSSELDRGSFPLDRGEDSDMAGGCGGGGGGNASEGGRQVCTCVARDGRLVSCACSAQHNATQCNAIYIYIMFARITRCRKPAR